LEAKIRRALKTKALRELSVSTSLRRFVKVDDQGRLASRKSQREQQLAKPLNPEQKAGLVPRSAVEVLNMDHFKFNPRPVERLVDHALLNDDVALAGSSPRKKTTKP